MDIYRPDVAAVFIGPDGIQQSFPGVYPVGISHQKFDDIKFLGSQISQFAAAVGIAPVEIQRNRANGQGVVCLLFFCGAGVGAIREMTTVPRLMDKIMKEWSVTP